VVRDLQNDSHVPYADIHEAPGPAAGASPIEYHDRQVVQVVV
jgi:hypothetical protein